MSDAFLARGARDRARAFVDKHADAFQRRALAAVLGEAAPDALLAELARHQDERGAIAAPDARGADLSTTLAALELLDAVDRLDGAVAAGAVGFVAAAQRADGSWPGVGSDSPANGPAADGAGGVDRAGRVDGEPDEVTRTGDVASLLARSPVARPAVLSRAAACLENSWSVESVQGGDFARIAAYVGVFSQLPSELADAALQWCGRELERGFRSGACDALQVARVFLRCGAPALPGAALSAVEVTEALREAQQPDGGWPGASPAARVRATLDALRALRLFAVGSASSC